MPQADDEKMKTVKERFPSFYHEQNLKCARYLQLPLSSIKGTPGVYKLCEQLKTPSVAAPPSATAMSKLSFSDIPEYISDQNDFLAIN